MNEIKENDFIYEVEIISREIHDEKYQWAYNLEDEYQRDGWVLFYTNVVNDPEYWKRLELQAAWKLI